MAELLFITIPGREHVKTEKSDKLCSSRNEYKFRDKDAVKIAKYENDRKFEEVDMKIASMKIINEANKAKAFDPAGKTEQFVK